MLKGDDMKIIYYDISEHIFDDLDDVTVDLFTRKLFKIEDISNLKILKDNLKKLEDEVDKKIYLITKDLMEDF